MARPKIYANDAERKAAYREKTHRLEIVVSAQINATLAELSEIHQISKNELVASMIRHSLTNHDWKRSGVWGKK